jgi:hypothetical protein
LDLLPNRSRSASAPGGGGAPTDPTVDEPASEETAAEATDGDRDPVDPLRELAPILHGSRLDPVAAGLLEVVDQASLRVTIDLTCRSDTSLQTVWATPRAAVSSSSFDPRWEELRPVPVSQLPQVLSQMLVLQSPRFVADRALTVSSALLGEAAAAGEWDAAIDTLCEAGIERDEASLLIELQRPEVRRWRVTSTWSTEAGSSTSELQGVDAGPAGQWLIGAASGGLIYTPQGHGEVMSAFRSVLPRNWTGTPLGYREPAPV